MYKYIFVLTFIFLLNCNQILCAIVPNNPCPNIFQYNQDNRGVIYGRIIIPNDLSGTYNIQVNVSYATLLNQNIQIKLTTPAQKVVQGAPLAYNLIFPIQNIIPKLTQILFNNKIYCSGPPELLVPGGSISNMWAQHQLRTSITGFPQVNIQQPQQPDTIIVVENYPSTSFQPPQPDNNNNLHTNNQNLYNNNQNLHNNNQNLHNNNQNLHPNNQNSNPYNNFNTNPFLTQNIPSFTPPPATRPTVTRRRTIPTRRATPTTSRTTTTTYRTTTSLNEIDSLSGPTLFTSPPRISIPDYSDCGMAGPQPLVIGGSDVLPGEFPWLVAIILKKSINYEYICTGNLISNRHIITVGHCVAGQTREKILCVLGMHNISNWASSDASILSNVRTINVHPDYQPKNISSDGDAAILVLEKEIQFQRKVSPICIWQNNNGIDNIINKEGLVVGWGKSNYENEFTEVPRKIFMPVVNDGDCYRSSPNFYSILSNRTFCAGKRNNNGPCTGDSGAGFIMKVNDRWTLRGIVSKALANQQKSCNLENYIVFADVAKVMNWIDYILTF